MSEMPTEIWLDKKLDHYLDPTVFGEIGTPLVKYTRSDLCPSESDMGRVREILTKCEEWIGNEMFDDDDRTGGDTQEERAENISDLFKEALQLLPPTPDPEK